ncbi:hypothetical protein [Ochrobactrum chromiisoli]|uniref:Uncharacterized protein n=1 Tax=Ochrobactrum chromiisoli TaxID=2993941 RepID=A0ABT3QM35_9HYPH|nr:hypothetical protein [Ochrobactrum chromiisoli]MCX2696672.1 hypothetical protein [Ochrobactrum chromiisoli]
MSKYWGPAAEHVDPQQVETALTAALPFLTGAKVDAQGIYDYVQGYEWRGDNGDYTPSDADREMLEDAIVSYLSAIEIPTTSEMEAVAPSPRAQALEEEELAIDKLRFQAFQTNSEADRQAYFDAVSKWFQDRHYRRMDAERALSSQTVAEQSAAARDVLAERRRQVEAEGWTPEHDDKWSSGEIAQSAACYALLAAAWNKEAVIEIFPWSLRWLKSTSPRRNLVKAGALILAEIERLDRLPASPEVAG